MGLEHFKITFIYNIYNLLFVIHKEEGVAVSFHTYCMLSKPSGPDKTWCCMNYLISCGWFYLACDIIIIIIIIFKLFIYLFIYLAAPGLSRSMRDLVP